jgi:hypothetical protein
MKDRPGESAEGECISFPELAAVFDELSVDVSAMTAAEVDERIGPIFKGDLRVAPRDVGMAEDEIAAWKAPADEREFANRASGPQPVVDQRIRYGSRFLHLPRILTEVRGDRHMEDARKRGFLEKI